MFDKGGVGGLSYISILVFACRDVEGPRETVSTPVSGSGFEADMPATGP